MSTATVEKARDHNRAFYFAHLSGLPYLWFTEVPETGWPSEGGEPITEITGLTSMANSKSQNIDLDGDTLVIGESLFDSNKGRVRVYRRSAPGVWDLEATIQPSSPESNSQFGFAVVIVGDTLFVAAPYKANGGSNRGSVFTFTRSGSTWSATEADEIAGAADSARLGYAISADSARLAVYQGVQARTTTNCLVYTHSSGATTYEDDFDVDTTTDWNYYTGNPWIDGDSLIVSWRDGGVTFAASVFTRSGSTWSLQQQLVDGVDADVGVRCRILGDLAVTGNGYTGLNFGDARVWRRSAGTWSMDGDAIVPSDVTRDNGFGDSLSIHPDGDRFYAGSPGGYLGDWIGGTIYEFTFDGSEWVETDHFGWSSGYQGDYFSDAIAVDTLETGQSILVGSGYGVDAVRIWEKLGEWEPPSPWEYRPGLMLLPQPHGDGLEIQSSIDPLGGIADAETVSIAIAADELTDVLRRQRTYQDSAPLVTNDIDAGADGDSIEVEHAIASASVLGTGTLYIGNQTITFLGNSGNTTFSDLTRGRYAILDSNLDEVTWKPRIHWDEALGAPPMVTLYPQTLIGRVLTIYRNWYDPTELGGLPLDKDQSEVRWRGVVTSHGMGEDGLSVEFSAISILDLLNAQAFTEQAEFELQGYGLPYNTTVSLTVNEKCFGGVGSGDDGDPYEYAPGGRPTSIEVDLSNVNTPSALVSAVNDALVAAKWDGTGNSLGKTQCTWYCQLVNGKIEIGAHVQGVTDARYFQKGDTNSSYDWDSWGRAWVPMGVSQSVLTGLLGFGDSDVSLGWGKGSWIGNDWQLVMHNFACWTNPNDATWSGYILAGVPQPGAKHATSVTPPARAAWHNTQSFEIPIDMDSYGTLVDPGDGGLKFVLVDDEVVYQVCEIDLARESILLVGPLYDVEHPICSARTIEPKLVVVPQDEDKTKYAWQVWRPTCRQWVSIGGGLSMMRDGVNLLLLQIMLSTGAGANGDFDVLPAGWGLSIPEDYVDADSFVVLHDAMAQAALDRDYLFTGPIDFAELLESEAKTLGFCVVQRDGKITAIPPQTPTHTAVTYDIDDSCRCSEGEITWQASPEGLINQIEFKADFDCLDEDYFWTDTHIETGSLVDQARLESETIENKGVRSVLWKGLPDTTTEIRQAIRSRLWRLSRESYVYECEVTRKADGLQIGDIVTVTDDRVINPTTGTRGITRHLGEVEGVTFDDFAGRGQVRVRLRYDWDEQWQAANVETLANPTLNVGALAPALEVSVQVDPTHLTTVNSYSITPVSLPAGSLVQIVDEETGASVSTEVVSYDSDTGALEVADSVAGTITTVGAVRLQPWSSQMAAAENDELDAAYIGGAAGLLTYDSVPYVATRFAL